MDIMNDLNDHDTPPNELMGVDLDEGEAERQTILVVEDDLDTVFLLKQILRIAGFNVSSATSGAEAVRKFAALKPDLVLLDIMMPQMDGWETLNYLRQMADVPVVVVSALGTKQDMIAGLQNGVDDYVPKPFYNPEVIARVKAVLRRANRAQEVSKLVYPAVDLLVDLLEREVRFKGQSVHLTPKEFDVVAVLAKHAPAVVSYEIITGAVWDGDSAEARKRTKYLIYLLRNKFKEIDPKIELILNIDRLGYQLQTEID